MNIFTIEITVSNGQPVCAIFKRDSIDAAYSAYHSFMASAMATTDCNQAMCMIVDEYGTVYRKDTWSRAVADE